MNGRGRTARTPLFGGRTPLLVAALCTALPATPATLHGQGYRGWVGTTVQTVGLRPYGRDTIPRSLAVDSGGAHWVNGVPVSCVLPDVCTRYVALDKEQLLAATQDVSLTAWGLGVEGVSFTTLLRLRAHAGSDILWPRADDTFDALLGYLQLQRGKFRFRAGRQEVRSGLGFPAFDGGAVVYTSGNGQVEVYGGRSLARGLREPTNQAMRGVEDYFVDEGVRLFGASARHRVSGAFFTARYHREVLADRSGLVGERGSLDIATTHPGVRVNAAVDYDFARDRLGKAHVTAGFPMREGRVLLEATARRYTPYFQMNTIWGFFDPVSYSEFELRGSWAPSATTGLWASAGRRAYEDTQTQALLGPLTGTGWRADAGGRWQLRPGWLLDGSYRVDWGPGAFLSSSDLALRYSARDKLTLAVSGTAFQQVEEFRVGDGRAVGGGLSFDWTVTRRATLAGGVSVLRHRDGGTAFTSPWNQTRGWTSLRVNIGEDPGLANRRRGR